jgi:serine/threonine protein kinase
MITSDGDVKLADLGIAKSSGSDMTLALTLAGTMIGTPEYASPEQCRDSSHVDTRADIYSLGATMYEMLTCTRPFQGTNAFDTVAKVLQEPLPPLRERNPEISVETAALVERMMSKDPADRPQTMRELVEIFDRMLSAQDPESYTALPENQLFIAEEKTLLPDASEVKVKSSGSRWLKVFCCIMFVAVIALVFAYTVWNTFYAKKERNVFETESARVSKTMSHKRYPENSKTDIPPHTDGVRDIHNSNGKAPTLKSVTIPDPANTFYMTVFQNGKDVSNITLPAAMLAKFSDWIREFPAQRFMTVHRYNDMPKPDGNPPSSIHLNKMPISRR